MPNTQKPCKVKIKFTLDYSEELALVYHELLNDQYTGRFTKPSSFTKSKESLSQLLSTKQLLKQMSLMAIEYDSKIVGMSIPQNTFTNDQLEAFRINADDDYHKIGKIFVMNEYRNKGIAYSACKQFIEIYPKTVLNIDFNNTSSLSLVNKLNVPYSHNVILNGVYYKIFKT